MLNDAFEVSIPMGKSFGFAPITLKEDNHIVTAAETKESFVSTRTMWPDDYLNCMIIIMTIYYNFEPATF